MGSCTPKAERGNIEEALQIANIISDDWIKSSALSTIAKTLSESGNIEVLYKDEEDWEEIDKK